jgi:FdhD protein
MGHELPIAGVNVWSEGSLVACSDTLAREESLEIQLNGNPLTVTMRTPGHDLDLTAGFLLTEGLINAREALVSLR